MNDEESNLVQHAIRELEAANVEHDVRPSIIGAVRSFASYGHSGGSASVVTHILNELLQFRALAPLTNNPDEWQDVADFAGYALWQNRRQSDAFSLNGGKTYYTLSEERRWLCRLLPYSLIRRMSERTYRRLVFPFHTAKDAQP